MSKLPKVTVPGKVYKVTNPKTGRTTCLLRTKKTGFGKFRFVKCGEKSSNPRVPAGSNFHPSVGWYD